MCASALEWTQHLQAVSLGQQRAGPGAAQPPALSLRSRCLESSGTCGASAKSPELKIPEQPPFVTACFPLGTLVQRASASLPAAPYEQVKLD